MILLAPRSIPKIQRGLNRGPFVKLPIVDTFRTLCMAPTPETREIIIAVEKLTMVG
jgi:hypothetical protein